MEHGTNVGARNGSVETIKGIVKHLNDAKVDEKVGMFIWSFGNVSRDSD